MSANNKLVVAMNNNPRTKLASHSTKGASGVVPSSTLTKDSKNWADQRNKSDNTSNGNAINAQKTDMIIAIVNQHADVGLYKSNARRATVDDRPMSREDSIDAEAWRVAHEIEAELAKRSVDGSIGVATNAIDHGEWWFVTVANYHVAADEAVVARLRNVFSMKAAQERPRRPYYVSRHTFNVATTLRQEQRQGYMSTLHFRFLDDPYRQLPP